MNSKRIAGIAAKWLNDGKGGVACVRTLKYDPSTATWSVAA